MYVMYMWEQMMGYMIIKTTENEIGRLAEWMEIIWTLYLIGQPRGLYVTIVVGFKIGCFLNMMCHEKSE